MNKEFVNKKIIFTTCIFLNTFLSYAQNINSKNKIMWKEINSVYWSPDVKENFITIDNCPIRYLTTGSGEPIFLIHTMRTQSDYFQKIIPELSKHNSIYAIDLPGHGGSGMPKNIAYTEQYFLQIARKFMDTLNLNNVTIIGESFGAAIALTLAATDENKTIKKIFAFNPYDYGKKGGIIRSSKTARNVFSAHSVTPDRFYRQSFGNRFHS